MYVRVYRKRSVSVATALLFAAPLHCVVLCELTVACFHCMLAKCCRVTALHNIASLPPPVCVCVYALNSSCMVVVVCLTRVQCNICCRTIDSGLGSSVVGV